MTNHDIDALARLLDGDLPIEEATGEARALGAFARALEASARPDILPAMEHKADMRAMLVEAARAQAAAPTILARMRGGLSDATSRWRYSMRTAAATGATAMALSSGGVALAAHRALPSDPFYAVKLTLEDIRLAFIGDNLARGRQMLAYAEDRLDDAQWSASEGDMDGAARALAEADATGRTAAGYIIRASQEREKPQLLSLLTKFSKLQRERIAALLPALSGDAAAAAEDAMVGLRRINQRVAVLAAPCAKCGDEAQSSGRAKDGARAGAKKGKGGGDAPAGGGEDFDLSVIPPASEPFSACDCVTSEPTAANRKATKTKDQATRKTDTKNETPTVDEPAEQPGDDPKPDPPDEPKKPTNPNPPDDDPLPEVPVKEAEDVKDDVRELIEDVLKNPSPPAPTPLPELPKVGVPSPGVNLP